MTTDYEALRKENEIEYGRAIGRIGKMLLQDRYDKRTHFIYELLQNAEDALRRRGDWVGSRAVTFSLSESALRISHFGAPFTEDDVRGICGIDASTKDYTAIGRFGIGFKSVYAFTTRPEVHSGDEDFVIRDYVLPSAVPPCERHPDETVILLPLADNDIEAFAEIIGGLDELGAEALLFLKQVDEVVWKVEGGEGGSYRRISRGSGFMREVQLIATGISGSRADTYLLFSRPVENDGKQVGLAEVAFLTAMQGEKPIIQPIGDSRLVVFFPTVLPTHTGFLIQGPYQTTPSRDNIPSDKPWNAKLAAITGELLLDVLRHLRDAGLFDIAALRSLPLERQKLTGTLFAPLFDRMVQAFRNERLVPTSTGHFARAADVRLARAQDVRDLFGPRQLGRLLGLETNVSWVTADITADRTPQLRAFLLQELRVTELIMDAVLNRMSREFLEEQSDTWILKLYRLLATQPALWRGKARDLALIRLEDGKHVSPIRNGIPQAFLPGEGKTDFPTVRATLCTSQTLKVLEGFGLTRPDLVDDVIRNLLPKYRGETIDVSNYDNDIARMVHAFQTDSSAQRNKLVEGLKSSSIIMGTDAATGEEYMCKPGDVYLASSRIVSLFRGVEDVSLLDNSYDCLRGEKVREMLEAAGATRILRPVPSDCDLSAEERHAVRRAAGWASFSTENPIQDLSVAGLEGLLRLMPSLPEEERRDRARQLWEALAELADRRGMAVLKVNYIWHYHYQRSTTVDAGFIRTLNATRWIPDLKGELRLPSEILFEELGWPANPLLESRIQFKPPAIAALAREVGIDPDVLDELKRLGVTDLEQLRTRLKTDLVSPPEEKRESGGEMPEQHDAVKHKNAGDNEGRTGENYMQPGESDTVKANEVDAHEDTSRYVGQALDGDQHGSENSDRSGNGRHRDDASVSPREFISYVGVHAKGNESDPDGLTQQERMDLEKRAIDRILKFEPALQRTPTGNEGYDLLENDVVGEPQRWIEVKAMAGSLLNRPVGLSQAQIDQARRCGDQYWLYVVEHVADDDRARILKIRNPFGSAGTFTFDRGWASIAIVQNCFDDLALASP